MSEWKPGTVIAALLDGIEIIGIVRGGGCHVFYADSVTTDEVAIKHLRDIRPVVVIDPEDREAVERLTKALVEAAFKHGNLPVAHNGIHGDTTEAALRKYAKPTPPKPAEPTGLGAVVEDAEGRRWVRTCSDPYPWGYSSRDEVGDRYTDACTYANIDAVRVLSEGVQP